MKFQAPKGFSVVLPKDLDEACRIQASEKTRCKLIAGGTVGIEEDATRLSPVQMRLWFEDVRAETVRIWMAQPATMAAIGYDGFAVGGDGPRKQGYTRTGADDPEAWQRPSQERGA